LADHRRAEATPAAERRGPKADFDYRLAFARNVGWVSAVEQDILRGKRIAIAGLGGVGGSHLVTLARLGVGSFSIADPDRFEIANFNRQPGATCKALGRLKCEVMAEMVRDINPTLDLRVLSEGVNERNIDAFLDGVDVYVDGLDFFAFGARQTTFEACARRNIPAVTAAPLGMGGAVVVFMPGGMTFEQYFRIKGRPEFDQAIRLLIGLAPAMLHRGYIVDRSTVDLTAQRVPSTALACDICAGMAAAEVLKVLLKRGNVRAAPAGIQFDAYTGKLRRTVRPGGNRHPLQRLAIAIARRQLAKKRR
jgi:molybdopterin-synthase adenylyltransferase